MDDEMIRVSGRPNTAPEPQPEPQHQYPSTKEHLEQQGDLYPPRKQIRERLRCPGARWVFGQTRVMDLRYDIPCTIQKSGSPGALIMAPCKDVNAQSVARLRDPTAYFRTIDRIQGDIKGT
jgi:hypothetical protein